jgi:glutamine synthetase
MYEEVHKVKAVKRLPATLLDALRLLENNKALHALLGEQLVPAYIKLKMQEWNSYTGHLSEWERINTLDC